MVEGYIDLHSITGDNLYFIVNGEGIIRGVPLNEPAYKQFDT